MWAVLATDIGVLGLAAAALAIVLTLRGSAAARILAVAIGFCALLPGIFGAAGYAYSLHQVDAALALADPAQKQMLLQMGQSEAAANLWFGGGSLLCTVPVALLLFAAAFLLKPPVY